MGKFWHKLLNQGIKFPHAHEPAPPQSFRLFCAYVSFITAWLSVIVLHFKPVEVACWTAIGFFAICMVFYMLKKLTKASIDLDDKSIALEGDNEPPPPAA